MKMERKSGGQFKPNLGGQFKPKFTGHFAPKSGGQFDRFFQFVHHDIVQNPSQYTKSSPLANTDLILFSSLLLQLLVSEPRSDH